MTLLLAIIYLVAGVLCIQRPKQLLSRLSEALHRTTKGAAPDWLTGAALILMVRFLGFLALLNAVMLFYATLHRQ